MNFNGRRITPFEAGAWDEIGSSILICLGPALIMFGLYLLSCLYPNYKILEQAKSWTSTQGVLTSLQAPSFNNWPYEPDNIFFKSASLGYSFNVNGLEYQHAVTLNPQGPRFYDGLQNFNDAGDSALSKRNYAKYANQYKYPPIGGWRSPKTPVQLAAPFKFASLDIAHPLVVKYDPEHPANSILSELIEEHQSRMIKWALGSIGLGGLALLIRFMGNQANSQMKSDENTIDTTYDKMFH